MTTKSLSRIGWLCCAALALLLASYLPALAQTPTPPTPREALMAAIQARVQRDVELGKPPEGIAGLQVLFGAEAANAGMTMAEVLDVYETAYQAAIPVKSVGEKLLDALTPKLGWVVAGIMSVLMAVVLLFHETLKKISSDLSEWLTNTVYKRVFSYQPFWNYGLRRYRNALLESYRHIKLPFRPEDPLDLTQYYVPLKLSGRKEEQVDALRAVADHKRVVITGAPGAGKSILLQHLLLKYAQDTLEMPLKQQIPVLVKLSDLKDAALTLEKALVKELERNRFPNAGKFVAAALEKGWLILLFDGLDEVTSDKRSVVEQIENLLRDMRYKECRVVITCRTAVYKGELAEHVERTLEVQTFTDQQVQQYLRLWEPAMHEHGKEVTQLLQTLRDRPTIMRMTYNPLLLTMIAFLYTDRNFVIPHSRAEFYSQAVRQLLEEWHKEHNRFQDATTEKRQVLQSLAVSMQCLTDNYDRRSIDKQTALSEMKALLPDLNLKPDDAQPLLDEIVKRSGLLLDEGEKYYFAHQTLQEYFVATAFTKESHDELLVHFQADRDAWREVIKLWCGLGHDSTTLLRKMYALDPLMGLECLADSRNVDATLSREIVDAFLLRLAEAAQNESLASALGALAADTTRTRGKEVFDRLAQAVTEAHLSRFSVPTSPDEITLAMRGTGAAQALGFSNRPEAASVLCQHDYDGCDALRIPLVRLGDLAIPALSELADKGTPAALNDLQAIGTVAAAEKLTALLWHTDSQIACDAAWRLATLLSNPDIESALREFPLSSEQRKAPYLEWLWVPFTKPEVPSLPVIAGRIGYWLEKALQDPAPPELPSYELDPRLTVPLCALTPLKLKAQLESDKELPEAIVTAADALLPTGTESVSKSDEKKRLGVFLGLLDSLQAWFEPVPAYSRADLQRLAVFLNALLDLSAPTKTLRLMLQHLPLQTRLKIIRSQVTKHALTQDDWRDLFKPSQYDFGASWHARGFKVLTVLLILLNVWCFGETVVNASQSWGWRNTLNNIALVLGLIVIGRWLVRSRWTLDGVEVIFALFGLAGGAALGALVGELSGNWLFGALFGAVFGAMSSAVFRKVGGIVNGTVGGVVGSVVGNAVGGAASGIIGGTVGGMVGGATGGTVFGAALGAVVGIVVGSWVNAVGYGPSLFIYELWGLWGLVGFWGVWLLAAFSLYRRAKRRQRAAENPLHGLLPGTEPAPITSLQRGWLALLPRVMALPMRRPRGKRIGGKR